MSAPSRPTGAARRRLWILALAAVPLALTFAVYAPITGCYFFADDWLHFQRIVNDPLASFLFTPFAGHLLVLRNAVFYLLYQTFGPDALWFFRIVLATHLANVALLFVLLRRLCGDRVACLGATLWGIAPMHEAVLDWYSVHGQALAATGVLAVLADVAGVATRSVTITARRTFLWSVGMLAAATAFGTAIGVLAAFPLAAWIVLRARFAPRAWIPLVAVPAALPVPYLAVHRIFGVEYAPGVGGDLTVLLKFLLDWRDIFPMLAHLFGSGIGGLLLGFVTPLAEYPSPLFYGVAAAFAVAVGATVALGPRDARRWMLALVVLTLGSYGVIAIGRAGLYAIVHFAHAHGGAEPRYHYLPSLFLTVAAGLALRTAGDHVRAPRTKTAALGATLAGLVALWQQSGWAVDTHDGYRAETMRALAGMRAALAATPPGSPVYMQNRDLNAMVIPFYFAGIASVYAIFFPDDGRHVFFVDPHPVGRGHVEPGTRIARMLVGPDAVPSGVRVWPVP